MQALKRVCTYIMKIKLMETTRLPRIAWEAGCKIQKTNKSKLITWTLVQDIRKWFAKWNVEAYLDKPVVQGKEGKYMLNFDIAILESVHTKWQTIPHRSKFDYYCKHVNTTY